MQTINVFTAFSGYDSQMMALQRVAERHEGMIGFDHDSYVERIIKLGDFHDYGSIEFISDGLRWSHYDFS